MTKTQPNHGLSAQQIEQFHREGYLMVPDLLIEEDLQGPMEDINAHINEHATRLVQEGKLSRDYAEEDFEHRLAKISQETDEIARGMWNGTLHGTGFFKLITSPRMLDVAESLCGEELIASSVYRLRPKVPSHIKSAVPWHQDSGYFEPYCDSALVLTAWIPLVNATEDNGCLWVIPGSHRLPVLPHREHPTKGYLEILDEDLPADLERVCVPVPRGGALLLTNRTVHVSFENRTDRVRWSMDLRYQNAALPTNAPIQRLENESIPAGEDPNQEGFVPVACYPPEADFLVRSRQRPDQVVTDPQEFARMRREHAARPVTNRWG
jgi:ectoine hydroxylase-related dioxygenase (phytanoyl-CoA dioxygenase family)